MLTSMNRLRSTSLNFNSKQFNLITTTINRYASTSSTTSIDLPPKNTLVILGGGLSGLATAYYFLRVLTPIIKLQTKIIILEKQDRTGGWCHSVPKLLKSSSSSDTSNSIAGGEAKKDVNKGSSDLIEKASSKSKSLVFETGPRSIRPVGLQGWLTVEMVSDISSASQIIASLTLA